ncbi:MAG: hypothetical protein NT072_10925 [Deltaproteobacteria bacterium]|nr:hypothetical protein [Deltaproteobacteria bacterium]
MMVTRRHSFLRTGGSPWLILTVCLAGLFLWTGMSEAATPPGTAITNSATVNYKDVNGNAVAAESAQVSTSVAGAPSLIIEVTPDKSSVNPGGELTYTIRYENIGDEPATGVVLVEYLSEYVTFVSATGGGVYAPGPPGGGTVTWTLGTVNPGASGTVTKTVLVPDTVPGGTVIDDRAAITSTEGSADEKTVSTPVGQAPIFQVLKSANPSGMVLAGGTVQYTLSYANSGNVPATGVVISDTIPAGVTLVSGSITSGGVLSGSTITWTLGSVGAGASGTVGFAVLIPSGTADGTKISNAAGVSTTEQGTWTTDAVETTVSAEKPALTVTKSSDTAGSVDPGQTLTYTIECTNSGNVPLSNVTVRDSLPAGVTFVSADSGGTFSGGKVTWIVASIAVGGKKVLRLTVLVDSTLSEGTEIENTAVATSSAAGEEKGSVTNTVAAKPSLTILKTADTTGTVYVGNNVTFTVKVTNSGNSTLTGVVVSDTLPANTSFVSADGGGTFLGGAVRWNIAIITAGESINFHVTLRLDAVTPGGKLENIVSASSGQTGTATSIATNTLICRTKAEITFVDTAGAEVTHYMENDTICIRVSDPDRNINPAAADTVAVTIEERGTGDKETLTLTEIDPATGAVAANTGVFGICFPSATGAVKENNGILTVAPDTEVAVTYSDPLDPLCGYEEKTVAQVFIDPYGVVFNAATGELVKGAVVTLFMENGARAGTNPLWPAGQPDSVTTGDNGSFAFPVVPEGNYYFVVAPGEGYAFPSAVPDELLPSGFVIVRPGSRGEVFILKAPMQPLNIDIPVDPPAGRLVVDKQGNKDTASIGDMIRYTVTVTCEGESASTAPVTNVQLLDIMPHGIVYIEDSSAVNGIKSADPATPAPRTLAWNLGTLQRGDSVEITYRAVVGPESSIGNGENIAYAGGVSVGKNVTSNTDRFKVKITEGVFTSRGTIIGKVFIDTDGDLLQKNPEEEGKDSESCAVEKGIPGVVIYMEDGTRVVTDKNGKFSIPGVRPGTHVLRVDEKTLPENVVLVPTSNRFMLNRSSQFVDITPGGLFKANFAAVMKEASPAAPVVLQAAVESSPAHLPAAGGDAGGVGKGEGESGLIPVQSEAPAPVPVPSPVVPVSKTDETVPVQTESQVPVIPLSEVAGQEAVVTTTPSLEEQIRTMTPELAFLNVKDGAVVPDTHMNVLVKAPLDVEVTLTINGTAVPQDRIGTTVRDNKGRVVIYEYIGVELEPGTSNKLTASIRDPFGNVRGSVESVVAAAGGPAGILILPERKDIPADGKTTTAVRIAVRDRAGNPAAYPAMVTVETAAGDILEADADPAMEGLQIPVTQGSASFTLRAPFESGEADITVIADDVEENGTVFFSPYKRDMFINGVGEVVIGHGSTGGDYGILKDSKWFDDGWYKDGRGALFAKGTLYEDIVLTAAYDSEKKKEDELFRESDTNLTSEEKYPIYGDESVVGYEAMSQDRLYLKLEKNKSYLLYGDYRTDLNNTALGAYNRSFNGVRYEVNTDRFKLSSFGSRTSQTQIVDAIPGQGISGFYYLTREFTPVVDGSERVVIEVRDRQRPDRVLSRNLKSRGSDYEIDYDMGTILFKEAVPSHDIDLNPIYIVVTYESEGSGKEYYIYGGRGAVEITDWFEIGATGITEEKESGNYHLYGADTTVKLPGRTTVKAEFSQSQSMFDESNTLNRENGGGWSFTAESRPADELYLSGYWRKLDEYFWNPSAVDASRGTRKYGVDARYGIIPETVTLKGSYFDEKDELNDMYHRRGLIGAETRIKTTKISVELVREESDDGYVPPTTSTSRSPFDISEDTPNELTAGRIGVETVVWKDFSVMASHMRNLTGEAYHASQAGINYQFNPLTRFYVREEYQKYEERAETRTVLGTESQVVTNTVAYNEYRLADGADGARNQDVMGLRNRFMITDHVTGSISGEYLKTVSGNEREGEPDAYAGSLGLEYLVKEDTKITTRFEHRNELSDEGRDTYLGDLGIAYRLNPDYTLLLQERYFFEEAGTDGDRTTSRTSMGLAYRPRCNDRFNALSRVEYKYDRDETTDPGYKEEAVIMSTEGVYQTTKKLQLIGKYAGKFVKDNDFDSYTDLVSARILYDITDRFDIGAEYGIMTSYRIKTISQGGSAEVGCRVIENLWLSLGYGFNTFDEDLTGDYYRGEGPYLKLRFKFDENTLGMLK